MRKLIVVISILFIAVIAASVFYFTHLQHNSRSQNTSLASIPADAAFLVSFQNDTSFYNIFSDFHLFESLIGKKSQHELNYLYSHFLKSPALAEWANKQTIYFSFHANQEQIRWLATVPLHVKLTPQEAVQLLNREFQELITLNADSSLQATYKVDIRELNTSFYLSFKSGTLLCSPDRSLIQRAIDDHAAHLPTSFLQDFAKNEHKNSNSIFNLHLNHSALFDFTKALLRTKPGNNLQLLEGLTGMSSLNMNFKSDALMFSGISTLDPEATKENYISIFTHQNPTNAEIQQIFPNNTAAYTAFACSNYPDFHARLLKLLGKRKQLDQLQGQLAHIRTTNKIDIDSALLNQWGNEFASIELNTRESIGIVQLKDSTTFQEMIAPISSSATDHIRRFDNSNLLYYSFGDPMLLFQRPYFTTINNYLICANTISTLEQFRKKYEDRQLLTNTISYLTLAELQAKKSTITFFLQNHAAQQNLKRMLRAPYARGYADTSNFNFKQVEAFSYQLSGYDGNFYSNFGATYHVSEKETLHPVWEAELSSEASFPPGIWNYTDSTQFILVQDKGNRLYGFSTEGRELWRKTLSGPILGQVHQLSDKTLILNTADRLYRFAPDGTLTEGFPVALAQSASHGVTLYQVAGQPPKLFIPANRYILGYDPDGKELLEWKNKTVADSILFDLKTADLDDFHYVIAITHNGSVHLFNHNGSLVSTWENQEKTRFDQHIGLNIAPDAPASSRLFSPDTSGMLHSWYFDKKQQNTQLGTWSPAYTFYTKNVQGDSSPELIYLDNKQLYVYSSTDSSLLFNYNFNTDIVGAPLFFPDQNGSFIIGIASSAKLLYAFDSDGSVLKGFPLEGGPMFYYGKLKNDGHRYALICRNQRFLSAYLLD